jgi:hypothetical protein
MYAEAQMRKDGATNSNTANTASAMLTYINALRQPTMVQLANVNQSQVNLDFIIDERARELHWEGQKTRFNLF